MPDEKDVGRLTKTRLVGKSRKRRKKKLTPKEQVQEFLKGSRR